MKKIIILFVFTLILSGCTNQLVQKQNNDTPIPEENTNNNSKTTYTIDEISKHNTKNDCWLLIENKIYNVTDFIFQHPGGKAIIEGCGKDATELFQTRPMGSGTPHSEKAQNFLTNFYIGDLQ